ncbi:fam-a protein [Plasmodium chabaudi chabaudi]|uniref:Fam-a protein n=1 Tax=Plasmodium chabaudi chabaudi TaxID=31271 RepID=A0A4V0KDD6_PLACU|nr:fam-a protein [Plasmodium chabaudi chabaudi]VTZ71354.1 fam-a protein [Plasmodium chabaudi chabaudi]|eukprot:XP_016655109.1 fam-a protein [Plasmodium chabaudi chabaudi]
MNKSDIQFVLFLLSIFVYLNNKTFATEPAPGEHTTPESIHHYPTDSSEEIYENSENLLCTNPEEIQNAEIFMNDAVKQLESHAKSKYGYQFDGSCFLRHAFFYQKKHKKHIDVNKIEYTVDDPNTYNQMINEFWDSDSVNVPIISFAKIVRVYNPNLILIQQRYKKGFMSRPKYFYAVAKKVQVTQNKTIIVMASANINDHNPSNNEYENPIVESANIFRTEVDSEDDIRDGKLEKIFVNIRGYLIEKKNSYINITFIESMDDHDSSSLKCLIKNTLFCLFLHK